MCMNTIKMFLASSCELAYERMIIGDKIRQADDRWRAKGVRLQLIKMRFTEEVIMEHERILEHI